VDAAAIKFYRQNRFIKLKQVIYCGNHGYLYQVISAKVDEMNTETVNLEERDTYAKLSCNYLTSGRQAWLSKISFSVKRLAGISYPVNGRDGVRCTMIRHYLKNRRRHYTWHADQYYWPLETDRPLLPWIPLQETTFGNGSAGIQCRKPQNSRRERT
jgi:hypothetical protein